MAKEQQADEKETAELVRHAEKREKLHDEWLEHKVKLTCTAL